MFALLALATLQVKTWTLYAAGDIMLNSVPASHKVFKNLKIPKGAIFYANQEIPLTNVKDRTSRKTAAELKAKKQFILKADPKHIANLKAAGISVVSLGNNHAMDGGAAGLTQMLALLDKNGIQHAGAGETWAKAVEPAVVTAPDGTKVAFLSYLSFLNPEALRKCTPAHTDSPGIAVLTLLGKNGPKELKTLEGVLKNAKSKADVVVVALHWGVERQPLPAPYQVALGRLFVDAGADVVLGAHPHVLQPGELYKGKPIIYSLGNFTNPGGGSSAIYKLTFERKKFTGAAILPTTYKNGWVQYSKRKVSEISSAEWTFSKRFPNPNSALLTHQIRVR